VALDLPDPERPLRIGTRGSPLALAQAGEARDRLMAAHGLPEAAFELVVIKTTGDRVQDRSLATLGGKGLFTREIEEALGAGAIDVAVHSMKDMPTLQPEGLVISALLPREDPRDGFVSGAAASLMGLPAGSVVGSSSLRRRAQVLRRRPDLRVVEFRGSVQTRLRKLEEGVAAATLLAMAGLRRLGIEGVARPIEPEEMLPAIAQGAIGVEQREGDARVAALLAPIHHRETGLRVAAERSFLAALDGSCLTPIAGLAELGAGGLRFRGEILRPDGSEALGHEVAGSAADGAAMGAEAAAALRGRAGPGFFAA
jgi:hydroxymethylbilane synthase